MRICFVTHGDIETLATVKRATGMAGPLIQSGHQVHVIIEDTPNNRARLALESPESVPLFFTSSTALADSGRKQALLRSSAPAVVWVCGTGLRNWVRRPGASRRTLMLIEHSELRSGNPEIKTLRKFWELGLEWSSVYQFDAQICASRALERIFQKRMRRSFRTRPLLYSPYAYNPGIHLGPSVVFDELRARYAHRKVILYLGALTANYGLFQMLEAVEQLSKLRRDFVFLLLGGGRHKYQAVNFIRDRGLSEVAFLLGYVPEQHLPSYFKLAGVFLSPLQDTVQDWCRCPSKLFMYVPWKKPVVTCRVGEAWELLREDGFYYAPGDIKGLVQRLDECLSLQGWIPRVDPVQHSWQCRAATFLAWLQQNWPTSLA